MIKEKIEKELKNKMRRELLRKRERIERELKKLDDLYDEFLEGRKFLADAGVANNHISAITQGIRILSTDYEHLLKTIEEAIKDLEKNENEEN